MVVYDVTDEASFRNCRRWFQEIDRYSCENVKKILIGAKVDMVNKRVVSTADGEEYARQIDVPFVEVSAKDDLNVNEAVCTLIEKITESFDQPIKANSGYILDAKREIQQPQEVDSDEESFSDDELDAGMNDLLSKKAKRSKPKSKVQKKKPGVRHARTNVNVFRLAFSQLAEAAPPLTGDPVLCWKCGVLFNSNSVLEKIPKKLPPSQIQSIHTAPPIHPKLEEFAEVKLDTDDGSSLWVCEFCGEPNIVNLEPEEIPQTSTVDYELQPAKDSSDENTSNVIFCIDISGSMCVTSEIDQRLKLKGMEKREAKNKAISAEVGDLGDQYLPGQRRGVTMVSRLQCVQSAVQQKIEQIAKDTPNRCVGLVTFSNEVTLIGDCSQEEVVVAGDRLYSWDTLQEIGQSFQVKRSISDSKDVILNRLWDLEESGATALGPALQLAIAIAGAKPGSRVILCTDGLANVGLGSLEAADSEVSPYYVELAEQAKLKGVTVSVISLIGAECCLEKLSIVTEQSAGTVQRVDPTGLSGDLEALLDRPVLGYTTMVMIILHRGLQYRGEMDDENENRYWLVRDVGNVTAETELTVSYGFRPKDHFDLSKVDSIPFQVQIAFTRPDGVQMLRIANAKIDLTDDRSQAERNANLNVIGTHAAQRAAKYAKQGNYEQAQMEARAAQRFMVRNEVSKEKVALWSNQVEQFDHVVRTERKSNKGIFNKKTNRSDRTVEALSKGTNLNSHNLF